MDKIETETKRKVTRSWRVAVPTFAAPALMVWRSSPTLALETIAVLPLFFAALPLLGQLAEEKQAKRAEAAKRRRIRYAASPQSHLLRLSDLPKA